VFSLEAYLRLYKEDHRPVRIRIEGVSGVGSRLIVKGWRERN
jgi:hypothetical protein